MGQPHPTVVITGGLAKKILPILPHVIFHDDLTLRGLYLFHLMNKPVENEKQVYTINHENKFFQVYQKKFNFTTTFH